MNEDIEKHGMVGCTSDGVFAPTLHILWLCIAIGVDIQIYRGNFAFIFLLFFTRMIDDDPH